MKYIIADPDGQNSMELRKILNGFVLLNFQGSFMTLRAAEDYCYTHPPDLAFIRLGTAELNGVRLAGELKKRNAFSTVVFISSQKESAVEAFEYQADGFLLISFCEKKIAQLVEQSIAIPKRKDVGKEL